MGSGVSSCVKSGNWVSKRSNVPDEWCKAIRAQDPTAKPESCKCGDSDILPVETTKEVTLAPTTPQPISTVAPKPIEPGQQKPVTVCYFTNWARYYKGFINQGADLFEMDAIPGDLCTHLMYGFVGMKYINGVHEIVATDQWADYPSGESSQ